MQFQIDYKVGDKFITVKLSNLLKPDATSSLIDSFERIGGHGGPLVVDWKFPLFVTSELLEEIIRNTCFECGGLMENAWASDDVKEIHIRKCTVCGHSHT